MNRDVLVAAGDVWLPGDLEVPAGAPGIVLFAHGSGSSRHSPRNRFVAHVLREAGFGTLLFDLLTPGEEALDAVDAALRFDIELLATRLSAAAEWLAGQPEGAGRKLGLFGASTGAAAALVAAARLGDRISAVVSRGGRPDLAGDALRRVRVPVLLIVGGKDEVVIALNRRAFGELGGPGEMRIVEGATHLFTEPGTLEEVARLAAEWFGHWLIRTPAIAGQH